MRTRMCQLTRASGHIRDFAGCVKEKRIGRERRRVGKGQVQEAWRAGPERQA